MKTSSAFEETEHEDEFEDEDDGGNDCERGRAARASLISRHVRVTPSSAPIVLELVLDPIAEFLLKSSRAARKALLAPWLLLLIDLGKRRGEVCEQWWALTDHIVFS
jgi:hypothetical protein